MYLLRYQSRLVEGWSHEDAMAELHAFSGLPVVWKGCRPFTSGFDPAKLRTPPCCHTRRCMDATVEPPLAESSRLAWRLAMFPPEGMSQGAAFGAA